MLVLVLVSVLTAGLPLLYTYIGTAYVKTAFPVLRNKRICLLIAHPDDEAMFFAPTVLALTRPETGNHVKILCLSTGDADGLGETRKKELVKSGMLLGLRDESDVTVIDDPTNFPDSMTKTWPADSISTLLRTVFVTQSNSSPTNNAPTVDIILTFDQSGVSSHPNHISLYHGARAFVSSLTTSSSNTAAASPVDVYTLTSVPIWRKYTSFIDLFYTLASAASLGNTREGKPRALISASTLWAGGAVRNNSSSSGRAGGSVSVAGPARYDTARAAMTHAHKSQMVWFRWGWITLSRYMVVNDLKLEDVEQS